MSCLICLSFNPDWPWRAGGIWGRWSWQQKCLRKKQQEQQHSEVYVRQSRRGSSWNTMCARATCSETSMTRPQRLWQISFVLKKSLDENLRPGSTHLFYFKIEKHLFYFCCVEETKTDLKSAVDDPGDPACASLCLMHTPCVLNCVHFCMHLLLSHFFL